MLAKIDNRKKRKEISARTRHQQKNLARCVEEAPWRKPDDTSQVVEVSDATDDSLQLSALKNVDANAIDLQATGSSTQD
eukprot:245207-Amphidinium_carterae.2